MSLDTMGMSGLPDMYTSEARGLRVYISGKPHAHGITVVYPIAPSLAN